jgi:glycosyltransferase involved in cell wall biosynthesis
VLNLLWLTPVSLNLDGSRRTTGGWLDALCSSLVAGGGVRVTAVCPNGAAVTVSLRRGELVTSSWEPWRRIWSAPRLAEAIRLLGIKSISRSDRQKILMECLDSEQFDLVHVHGTESTWMQTASGLTLPRVLSIQGILTYCSVGFWSGLSSCDVQWSPRLWLRYHDLCCRAQIERQYLPAYSHVLCQGTYAQQFVTRFSGRSIALEDGRILRGAFYCGQSWAAAHRRRPVVFSTLAAQPYKGVHHVLTALSRPGMKPFVFQVAGVPPSSEYGRILRRISNRLGVADQVQLLGNLDASELRQRLLDADLYLHPSTEENTPNALAEAMALGLPCVVSRLGGSVGYIREGVSGISFDPLDPNEASDCIRRVCADHTLRTRLGAAAREESLARHDPARVTRLTIDAYHQVLNDFTQ